MDAHGAELVDVVESICGLPVQNPQEEVFSSADLRWTCYGTTEHHDMVVLIPFERVDGFIIGECANVEAPTRFHIEKGKKRSPGSLKDYKEDEYLEQKLYWCSFGPEDYGEDGGVLPSRKYRLNTRNRAARPQSMRGCTCRFEVIRLYARPVVALIKYIERRHVNRAGFICHGPLDKDAIGPGAKKTPYLSSNIKQQTMSMIYLGIPEENVLEKHIEGIQRYCGLDEKVMVLASQDVHKLGMIIKRSTHELALDDQASIRMWVEGHKKSIFFYQDSSETDAFILGIQTEWQLQQMIRFGHQSLIAADSTFGIKRLKYPLCTLLVFDSRQHALPVAWVITRSFSKSDVTKWMKALVDRARSIEPGWKASAFMIDDAAADVDPIRDVFACPVMFSLWRIRRTWLRNVIKKCHNSEVRREIFKRLGQLVYSIFNGVNYSVAMEELLEDFVDQTTFLEYFKAHWVPKIDMWLSAMKSLPLASQEASGAIETYHLKLKTALFDDSHLGALRRVDWLVHRLTTEVYSSYWLARYADGSDSFQNVKEEYIASTSWHRALQIPDSSIEFDEKAHLFAKVYSPKDANKIYLVWNPGSEFAFCECAWSLQGNLCKHVIKVNMMCQSSGGYHPSMSLQSLQERLLDLWRRPMDDSISLDLAVAWSYQMLDQIQKYVELNGSKDISSIVNNFPVQWASKGVRTSLGVPSSRISSGKCTNDAVERRNKKRKRLSQLR
ncbi:hypothetical protein SAY87_019964 [Trapa incisa]|uniref:SWIM-type domain-containing protein n=1 Tax=Trapa incisa TaxID=236973 RepID=A0AAN7K6L3_9MYRT|nr:hypothetical protein SAY87_019964 [Trapa incisa]